MSRALVIARGIAARVMLVLGSVALALLIAELVVRLVAPPEVDAFFTPFVHDDSTFTRTVQDPELLYTLAWYIPHAKGQTGSAPVRINNLGLRDERDYPAEKPANCFRVLGIGDSMTFGKGVAAEKTFLAVLEDRLRARHPDRCIEVLNAGMPNTNFYVQWLHYQLEWHKLNPDLLVVAFFVYNDTQLQDEEEPFSMGWMEFIDRHDWLKRSALVRWAYHRAFFAMGQAALDGGLPRYYDPEYEGWDQFREAVHELVLFTREQRTALTFALVPIPEGYDDYPYLEYHELVTRFLTQEHRIPTYDLLNAVRGIDARKHWVHPSDGHPDAFVHEQMGIYMDEIMPWGRWIAEAAGRP